MVNSDGQLYTIEGISAGLIMLMTAYIVVNSTSVYTPGDTHISDMQLEVIGGDALNMMNTPPNGSVAKSPLQTIVEQNDAATFTAMFLNTVNMRTGAPPDSIQFTANVTYITPSNDVNSTPLAHSSRTLTGAEHAVHVSEWVIVENNNDNIHRKRAELVEVLLWRD